MLGWNVRQCRQLSGNACHLMEGVIDNNGMTGIHSEHLLKDVGNACNEDCTAVYGSAQCIERQVARIESS